MSNNLTEKPKQNNNKQPPGYAIIPKIMVDRLTYLSGNAFKVYITIYSFKPNEGGKNEECYPSVDSIIQRSGLSPVTVKLALKELKDSKVLIIQKKGRGNKYLFPAALTDEPTKNPQIKVNSSPLKIGAPSPPATGTETDSEYLTRKQLEFPEHNVREIYTDFLSKCGSKKYPKMKPTRRKFDDWLKKQDTLISDEGFQAAFGEDPKPSSQSEAEQLIAKKYPMISPEELAQRETESGEKVRQAELRKTQNRR
jgi:hypothetical protein